MQRRRAVATGMAAPVLVLGLVLGLVIAVCAPAAAVRVAMPDGSGPLRSARASQELSGRTAGTLVERRTATGALHQVITRAGHPIPRPAGVASGAPPEAAARAFLHRYGAQFAITDDARQLAARHTGGLAGGGRAVRFQQVAGGLPVLGGDLVVALDDRNDVLSATGETSPAPLTGTVR